jgi:arylsulfatase A-like enzyme
MKARDLLVSGLLAGALAAMATVASAQTTRPPNIAVIMTDDVGWGDLGSYGGGAMRGAPTPNLDRLASEGMRFVNYYGQASCTAGRASFITGRIPIRTSLSAVLAPGDPNGLTKQTPTIAQYLKQANYTTVQLGKWHVGDKPENFPTANGFDEMYDMLPYYAGVYAYADKELHPSFPFKDKSFMALWDQVDLSQWDGKAGQAPTAVKKDFTYADLSTGDDEMRAKAIDWLKAHAKDANPFFMSLCFLKVDNPNNPSPRWKGKSPGGGNYLDALMELDDNSGQVVQAIRELGIDQNTLVVWTTDNGAWIDAWPDAGYTPLPRHEGVLLRGRLPRAGDCLVAGPRQARHGQYGHVVPHGLVADHCQARRPRATAPRLEGQWRQSGHLRRHRFERVAARHRTRQT